MKWHYPAKKFSWYEKAKTLDLLMKRNKLQGYRTQQKQSNGKQEINFDVQKISMLDLSKLTHEFFVAIRIEFPKS